MSRVPTPNQRTVEFGKVAGRPAVRGVGNARAPRLLRARLQRRVRSVVAATSIVDISIVNLARRDDRLTQANSEVRLNFRFGATATSSRFSAESQGAHVRL